MLGLALQGANIIVTGDFTGYNGVATGSTVRLLPGGALDTAFTTADTDELGDAVLVQPDDEILLVGAFTTVEGSVRNFAARLAADGTLDTSFDPAGRHDDRRRPGDPTRPMARSSSPAILALIAGSAAGTTARRAATSRA